MRTHVVRSAELVATAAKFRGPVEAMIRHHHENFDGSGYPDGVAGEEIPIGARIIMIADTLDAMTTDRPYRRAMIRHHHENFDGSGYPDGVAGEEIPIGARIIMIADTLESPHR